MKTARILALAAALGAAWPASAPAATKLWFGTHNVKRGDAEFTPFAGVLGFQEVEDSADKVKMRQSLPGYDRFVPKGDAGDVPIAWDRGRFALVGKPHAVMTHKGESGVTPSRWVNWVRLKVRRTGVKFFFVNTHFISKAWTKHPERRKRWKKHARVLRNEVAKLRATGLPVFGAGDFNRRGKPLGIPGMTYVGAYPVPRDHLYVSDEVAHGAVQQLPKGGSDHFAWRLQVEF